MHKILCMNRKELGKIIASLRKQRGWDQAEAGRRAGVSRAFVCNLERGTGGDPGLQKVLNILALFSRTLEIREIGEAPTLDDLLAEQDS
ncbi:MAG: helix-turn-helix domain-containing protein [Desulfovibrionales bacterium]|nr:MAG: helix-turn-helix domain-containing protein [Desulfovibrionales bacterium]